jgi:hypothetical protein
MYQLGQPWLYLCCHRCSVTDPTAGPAKLALLANKACTTMAMLFLLGSLHFALQVNTSRKLDSLSWLFQIKWTSNCTAVFLFFSFLNFVSKYFINSCFQVLIMLDNISVLLT